MRPMDDAAIGWGGLALSLILVAVAVGLSVWQGLRLERDMLWACGRALVQLLAVGYLLLLVVDEDTPVIWAWALGRGDGGRRRAHRPAAGARGARHHPAHGWWPSPHRRPSACSSCSAWASTRSSGRAVVPIAGMMIGNSIGSIVVAARRIVGELADRRPEVEARLALGQPWQQASKPFVRSRAAHRAHVTDREHQGGRAWCSCPAP